MNNFLLTICVIVLAVQSVTAQMAFEKHVQDRDLSYAPPDVIEEHYNRICVYWDSPKRKYCEWTTSDSDKSEK